MIRGFLIVALVLLAGGCAESVTAPVSCAPDAAGPSIAGARRDSLPPTPTTFLNVNDQWALIARRVPGGWGGAFFEAGKLTMYLVDPSQQAAAAAALSAEFPDLDFADADVWKGRWDFAQLYDWYRYIRVAIGWPEGLVGSDIDEYENRLTYVVEPEAMDSVRALFDAAALPCELVRFEEATTVRVSRMRGQ